MFVDRSANVHLAPRRIACRMPSSRGQTCVAPDFVLADAGMRVTWWAHLRVCCGGYAGVSLAVGRMFDAAAVCRVRELLDRDHGRGTVVGGATQDFPGAPHGPRWRPLGCLMPEGRARRSRARRCHGGSYPWRRPWPSRRDARLRWGALIATVFANSPALSADVVRCALSGTGMVHGTVLHGGDACLPFGGVGIGLAALAMAVTCAHVCVSALLGWMAAHRHLSSA